MLDCIKSLDGYSVTRMWQGGESRGENEKGKIKTLQHRVDEMTRTQVGNYPDETNYSNKTTDSNERNNLMPQMGRIYFTCGLMELVHWRWRISQKL